MMFCSDVKVIAIKPGGGGGVWLCLPAPSGKSASANDVSAQVSFSLSINILSTHELCILYETVTSPVIVYLVVSRHGL